MAWKRHSDEDILKLLRVIELQLTNGSDVRTACRSVGVSDATYYSAIVVASDHGGMLTGAELGFLNAHSSDILDFVYAGGGVAAFAESDEKGLITGHTPFGFIPFLVSSTAFGEAESGNTVTAFGAGLGLVNADVNGNFSHNLFTATGGMTPVDLRNGESDQILSLAFSGRLSSGGIVQTPEPGTLAIFSLGLAGLVLMKRRKRKAA